MNTIRDRIHSVTGKHKPRYLTVLLSYTVDIMAEIQSQIGHIQQITAAKDLAHLANLTATENAIHKLQGKLVLTRRHGRMGGKDALLSHCLYVGLDDGFPAILLSLLIQQLDRQETGVPFVHMKPPDLVVAQGAEHLHPADTENHFLAKPVVLIAPVKIVGQSSVPFGIFRQVGIQKIDRHLEISIARHFIFPRAQLNGTTLNSDAGSLCHFSEEIFHYPIDRLFRLPAD